MKKILTLLILLGTAFAALAAPALPGKYSVKQPDGSILVLENHGDEYFNWTTDSQGRIVEMQADGFYREVDQATHMARMQKARAQRAKVKWSTYETAPETNFGDRKVLCILANFS